MVSVDGARGVVAERLSVAVDKALHISRPVILRHIAQTRRTRPDATPAEIVDALGRRFTAAAAGTGAATGATAAAPGVSTSISLALAAGDAATFTGVAAVYVFSLAEIYGVPVEDLERRRTLLLGVMLGDSGAGTVTKMAERTGAHWGRKVVTAIPTETLKQINKVLGRNVVTKYGTRQGVLVLGKQVPFGLGAVIGGAGNALFAQVTIRSARRAFGQPPSQWPEHLLREPSEPDRHTATPTMVEGDLVGAGTDGPV